MYGKLAITCLKYQVSLYGSEAITYLNALWVIRLPPPPTTGSPPPSLYGSITFTHLEDNSSMVKLPYLCEKSKGKTCMVEEPSHVKQLYLNHVCKIGLNTSLLFLTAFMIALCIYPWRTREAKGKFVLVQTNLATLSQIHSHSPAQLLLPPFSYSSW